MIHIRSRPTSKPFATNAPRADPQYQPSAHTGMTMVTEMQTGNPHIIACYTASEGWQILLDKDLRAFNVHADRCDRL